MKILLPCLHRDFRQLGTNGLMLLSMNFTPIVTSKYQQTLFIPFLNIENALHQGAEEQGCKPDQLVEMGLVWPCPLVPGQSKRIKNVVLFMQNVNKETICPKISSSVIRKIDITDYQSARGKGFFGFQTFEEKQDGSPD